MVCDRSMNFDIVGSESKKSSVMGCRDGRHGML